MKKFPMRFALPLLALVLGQPVLAAKAKTKKSTKPVMSLKAAVPANPTLDRNFSSVLDRFKKNELQKKSMWDALDQFTARLDELSLSNQIAYQQVRSQLLFMSGFPILASEFAAEALSLSSEAFGEQHTPLWRNLWIVSKEIPIQFILEDMAPRLKSQLPLPPEFGSNWNYILGNALLAANKLPEAKQAYEKVVMQDRYYLPAQYQLGMLSIDANKPAEAESYLRAVLNPTAQNMAEFKRSDVGELVNYTHMALGRLYYQEQRFNESAREFRLIRRSSNLFYEALFEQSWALFLAGSMKHSLGILYATQSPYFSQHFNPEIKVLESMVYYWMCRYDDARGSLADFAEVNRVAIDSLGVWLDRQRLTPETSYQLFENLITGVSEESIGIPIKVLKTAAESDVMLLARDQYASLIQELATLEGVGIYGQVNSIEPYKAKLLQRAERVRNEIGKIFLNELQVRKAHFDELYSQSQFLYLELLMSQKEQILGRELHADSKVRRVTDKAAFEGWSKKTQSWQDTKNEYWWDEIGYQIIDVEPLCKI